MSVFLVIAAFVLVLLSINGMIEKRRMEAEQRKAEFQVYVQEAIKESREMITRMKENGQ